MKKVNVATLKEGLSRYLHQVEAGEEIVVTSHRRPVARVVSYHQGDLALDQPTRPMKDLLGVAGIKPKPGASADELLAEDRRRR